MHELYELRETLCKELKSFSKKNEITGQNLEMVDSLAHSIKNIDKIIEKEDDREGMSMDAYRGRSGRGMYRGIYEGYDDTARIRSYDRGRGEEMVTELRELMKDAKDDKTRTEFQKFISKIESM